jgi:membrane-bound lytic murein transglycosylase
MKKWEEFKKNRAEHQRIKELLNQEERYIF